MGPGFKSGGRGRSWRFVVTKRGAIVPLMSSLPETILNDPDVPSQKCTSWSDIRDQLESFPLSPTKITAWEEGPFANEIGPQIEDGGWIFRGQASKFALEPSIWRQESSLPVPALELMVLNEFKARARNHLNPRSIPTTTLDWLALMQHHGAPTRLLDFSYSPFVALYFAIRGSKHLNSPAETVRLWALDSVAVNNAFDRLELGPRLKTGPLSVPTFQTTGHW